MFVLVGDVKLGIFVLMPTGDMARGDCNVPLSRAGRIFVRVLVGVRCDDDDDNAKSPLRKTDGTLSDDDVVEVEDD